jgi:hypothetical protein
VPDGRYAAVAELADAAGNTSRASATIAVDRPVASLTWSAGAFDPLDGDELSASARLTAALRKDSSVSVRIEDASGGTVRSGPTGRAVTSGRFAWAWDGRDGHGALVPPGRYVGVVAVVTALGTTDHRRPITVAAFDVPALPATVRAGAFLTLWFRSVEALGGAPTVTVVQKGATVSRARAVSAGQGRYLATVRIPRAGVASLVIAARDVAGGTNVARLTTRATK